MKKTSIILIVILLMIILTSILSGCSKSADALKLGIYISSEEFAYLSIGEDKTFELFRGVTTSYVPAGNYTIEGDKLLLHINNEVNEGIIEFKINGDILSFESGEVVEGLIKKGMEFIYKYEK